MADSPAKERDALKALHSLALSQFKYISEYEDDQRKRELEALNFQVGDQWTEDAKSARAGLPASASGTPAVPARPMLVMRTLDQPLAQVANQERNADLAVTIVAKDGRANKETADIFAGLVRSIQSDSHSDDVYSWAFQRMSACGRGYWRVNKAYADERTGFEQVLRIEPIKNGFSVYMDPVRKWHADGGFWEPEYTFVTEDIPEKRYKELYGKSKLAIAEDGDELSSLGDDKKYWSTDGEAGKTYRVAEYFYATYKTSTLTEGDQSRDVITRTILWGKMNGCEWLEKPQEWDGHFIPIIEDSGYIYDVGGKVVIEGMIQPAISPCRMVNYTVTAAMEKMGSASLSPWIGIAGQFQNYESWWDQANLRNFSKLEYNAMTTATGNQILPPPTRNNDEPAIQAYEQMAATFINFVRSSTGVPDAALGNINPNDRSGRAIEELKRASEVGTSGYLSRHATAIRHTGLVLVDMIPSIYDTPGRIERIIDNEGEESYVMLNAPFTKGQDGQPQAYQQPNILQRGMQAMGMSEAPEVKHYDLAQGKYGVVVNVGKNEQTRRQEAQAGMAALAQAAPELVPRYADLWIKTMDIPNAEALAARVKPPGVDDESMPPEAKAAIEQMQAQMQELQALADDNQTKLKIAEMNAQVKAQTSQSADEIKAVTQQSADHTRLEVAGIAANTQIAVAEIKAGMDEMKLVVQAMLKKMDLAHDTHMHALASVDEAEDKAFDHEMGAHSEERQHERAREMQDRDQAHQARLATTPPPKDPNKVTKPNGADRG